MRFSNSHTEGALVLRWNTGSKNNTKQNNNSSKTSVFVWHRGTCCDCVGCPTDPFFLGTKPLSWRLRSSVPFAVPSGHMTQFGTTEHLQMWYFQILCHMQIKMSFWLWTLSLSHPVARIWIRQQSSLTIPLETPPREIAVHPRRKEPSL